MKTKIEITYYEDNDLHLEDKYWTNKQNVNLFINEELEKVFSKSLYESENLKSCMEYLEKNYSKAESVKTGTYPTGWNYMIFEL